MGRAITLFTDYQTKENNVTNHCGLMLKLVYEESPALFNRFLEICCANEGDTPIVGPAFEQQKKLAKSVPDLLITQQAFQVLFEVKTTNWYHEDQLKAHASSFDPCVSIKLLVLLCNFEEKNDTDLVRFKSEMKKQGIIVVLMTFEELYEYFDEVCTTPMLKRYLEEFGDYLDRNGLLPIWKYTLDVVNCGVTKDEVLENVYICPAAGRQYHHQRARYFGAYWNRAVNCLFEIDAVVIVPANFAVSSEIKWKNNSSLADSDLVMRAEDAVRKYRSNEIKRIDLQVFLLDNYHKVEFKKNTPGGMFGSKIYFRFNNCNNMNELVSCIDHKDWSKYGH